MVLKLISVIFMHNTDVSKDTERIMQLELQELQRKAQRMAQRQQERK